MKIKIVQFYCGNDPTYQELTKIVSELNNKYCEIHGYEYTFDRVERKDVDNYINTNDFRWCICAYKFKVINKHLTEDDCDYLVFMDADAVVSNPNIKIEDLIDNQHSIFFSRSDSKHDQQVHMNDLAKKMNVIFQNKLLVTKYFEEFIDSFQLFRNFERLLLGYLFMNEGLIVIKNNALMKDFFKDANVLVPYFNDLKFNTMTTDGRILHFLTLRNKYKNSWKFMDDYAQGSHASINEAKYDEDRTFVLHDYQIQSFKERLNNIKQLKNNKWWTKVENSTKNNKIIKIDWTKYVDAIYCLHFLPYKYRLKKIEATLNYIDILDSPIFHWYYTYPNAFDEMIADSIKPTYSDYLNKRRKKTLNLNIAYHNMFREIQELGYNKVLIIEDDCTFIYGRKPLFAETLEHLPTEWDYIHFDKVRARNRMEDLKTLQDGEWFCSNFTGGYYATGFTMWSKNAIDIAVKLQEKDLTIADHLVINRDDSIPTINALKRYIPKHTFIYQHEGICLYNFS